MKQSVFNFQRAAAAAAVIIVLYAIHLFIRTMQQSNKATYVRNAGNCYIIAASSFDKFIFAFFSSVSTYGFILFNFFFIACVIIFDCKW